MIWKSPSHIESKSGYLRQNCNKAEMGGERRGRILPSCVVTQMGFGLNSNLPLASLHLRSNLVWISTKNLILFSIKRPGNNSVGTR